MQLDLEMPWLLVATPQLQDPNFQKTVLLMAEHDKDGAMGFIINKPAPVSLKDIIVLDHIDVPDNFPVWFGGPVDNTTGVILHNQDEDLPDFHLKPGISITSAEEVLVQMIDHEPEYMATKYPFRFLVGYAGWKGGQLEEELRHGAWIQIPCTDKLLFDTPWNHIWHEALASVGVNPKSFVSTSQPYLN